MLFTASFPPRAHGNRGNPLSLTRAFPSSRSRDPWVAATARKNMSRGPCLEVRWSGARAVFLSRAMRRVQEPPLLLRHGPSSSSPEGSKARRAKSSLPLLDPAAILASPTSPMRALGIEAAWRRRGGGGRSLCTSFVQPVPPAVAAEAHSILAGLAAHGLPCFSVPPSAARLLCSPTDFRTALLQGARTARRRVSLTSLYLGDGPLETALVDELVRGQAAAAAATCSAPRQLLCLLDYHRARRPGALLLPAKLSRAPGGRVCLLASPSAPRAASGAAWGAAWGVGAARAGPALFASEQLAGGLSEVLGVHHMKLAL